MANTVDPSCLPLRRSLSPTKMTCDVVVSQAQILSHHFVEHEDNGRWVFDYIHVVFEVGNLKYSGQTAHTRRREEIDVSALENVEQIPVHHFCPPFTKELTLAPTSPPVPYYIKRQNLGFYDRSDSICSVMVEEARTCEVLKRSPHPNLAQYYGCEVQDGRVTGLCFAKYSETLMSKLNPRHMCKRLFDSMEYPLFDPNTVLAEAENAVRHLHKVGIVHNDINPSNIMLDTEGKAVVIDFGSCRPIGDGLATVGRTYEWYDERVQFPCPVTTWMHWQRSGTGC